MDFGIALLIIYIILFFICGGIYYLKKNRFSNISENIRLKNFVSKFLPFDTIKELTQLFYIGMVFLLFVDIILVIFFNQTARFEVMYFDILISFIVVISLIDKSYIKLIVVFCLLPADSIAILLGFIPNHPNIVIAFTLIRFVANFYAMVYYNYKFINYTEENNLSLTMLIFVLIIVFGVFITIIYENVSPLDGFLMVSNAFTTSGYSAPGDSVFGKITDIFLVWGGYLLSTVGTATLTVAILHKKLKNNDKNKINELNRKVDELNEKIDNLTDLIEKNN